MKWIYDLTYEQLRTEVTTSGMKPFSVDQIFQWLYWKIQPDVQEWSNISKSQRLQISETFNTDLNTILKKDQDSHGTVKYLFQLSDGHRIESVLIKEKGHYTFCISTQVGCALGCLFCATGTMGLKRNLTAGEILSQVLTLKKELQDNLHTDYAGKLNLVFMGMGEPLMNYPNLKQALEIITAEKAISISPRNITISTAGILKNIQQLERDFPKLKISFSLNASGARSREEVMPISKKESLAEILAYFRNTASQRKHRITFEYVMLKGKNDSMEDARKIVKLLHGIPCKINLIPFNPVASIPFETPPTEKVEAFDHYLHSRGHTVVVRWSKGKDIRSACGQLAVEES